MVRWPPGTAVWEEILGRRAPDPTEVYVSKVGAVRLAPAFPEWMMGLPLGWVTSLLDDPEPITVTADRGSVQRPVSRNDVLRGIGNGVVPQQAALAVGYLTARLPTRT